MKFYVWSFSPWALDWNPLFRTFPSGSLVYNVSLLAFRFGLLFDISLPGVFHSVPFVLDPRLQHFVWDLAFVTRR